ncbi:hypothetical protein KCU67_g6373, partial [Aureobasidium melanogenum]
MRTSEPSNTSSTTTTISPVQSAANPSAPIKPPLNLPNEILQRIAQLTDDEDLPALRATSRVFRDETETRFADAFFTDVYYPATPEGLERLTKIAEHPLFSQKVRNCIATGTRQRGFDDSDKALGDISAVMHGRNFGILLVDSQSHYVQNEEAAKWAVCLRDHKPERFTVDIQCSTGSTSDRECIAVQLYCTQMNLGQCCPIVVRFLRGNSVAAQATTSITQPQRRRTLTYTGTHTYFYLTRALMDSTDELVEINFSQWRWPGSSPCITLQHIVRTVGRYLRRLVIRDAHTTSSWKHKEIVQAIMSCQLDFCHLSNLTSSGDGVEFKGTFEASGVDEIKAGLIDMKWTSKTEEEVVEVA